MNNEEPERIPPKVIQLAIKFGIIKIGYNLEDYLREAVETGGYETANIWGIQGSGKSTRMLQMGYWIYGDWDVVLKSLVFKPADFVERLKAIPKGNRTPCLLWDDIGVHYTSSTFRTDIKQYEAIDSAWAAIRTKVNVIIMSIPLIDRLAKNIKDNITLEIFIGRNQMEVINRIFHLPGIQTIESNFFKATLERPAIFDLYEVPKDVWDQYWDLRLDITEGALDRLGETTEISDPTGYIPIIEAAKFAMEKGIRYGTSSIQQDISRGVARGRKIANRLYVDERDFYDILEVKGFKPEILTHTRV